MLVTLLFVKSSVVTPVRSMSASMSAVSSVTVLLTVSVPFSTFTSSSGVAVLDELSSLFSSSSLPLWLGRLAEDEDEPEDDDAAGEG